MIIAAVVASVLAVATTAVTLLRDSDDGSGSADEWSSDGPVVLPDPHGYLLRGKVGKVFTDAYVRIKLSGDEAAVLERVELIGPDIDHFEVLGILLAGPHRRTGAVTTYDGFSPHPTSHLARGFGKLVPAEGARLAPGPVGSVLQIGLKIIKRGLAVRAGVRLYYTVGGKKYTAYQQGSMVLCPPDMTNDACLDAMETTWTALSSGASADWN